MVRDKNDKIFFLLDSNHYIYQWEAKYYDDDEYDHHSYHILHQQKKRENQMIIKPIEK